MLKIVEMIDAENLELLEAANFGHLGCARDGQPYVLPMHFAFDGASVLFLTVDGQKTVWLDQNPKVCLQIEKTLDERHWQSAAVFGLAQRLTNAEEIGRAASFIFKKHSSLTPALNRTIVDGAEKTGGAAIYRINPIRITGRKTAR